MIYLDRSEQRFASIALHCNRLRWVSGRILSSSFTYRRFFRKYS